MIESSYRPEYNQFREDGWTIQDTVYTFEDARRRCVEGLREKLIKYPNKWIAVFDEMVFTNEVGTTRVGDLPIFKKWDVELLHDFVSLDVEAWLNSMEPVTRSLWAETIAENMSNGAQSDG